MPTITPLVQGPVSAAAYACTAGAGEPPFAERHAAWSVSYVQAGSFGCTCGGRRFELMPGSVLLGRPGDEYTCSHDHHHGGDECLAFFFEPALAEDLAGRDGAWASGALPPVAELVAWGELARRAARAPAGPRVDELGAVFAAKVMGAIGGRRRAQRPPRPADRRRAVQMALWIEAQATQEIDLQALAGHAGLSVFHALRLFAAVHGVTPHQYLLRCRLRHAARLLAEADLPVTQVALASGWADLSNFVRSFRRAAGVSPRAYRQASRGDRKILQVRLQATA